MSPLVWRGVAATENTIEQINVPLGSGSEFRPDSSVTIYKPEDSLALDVAQRTAFAKEFLRYARFPLAEIQTIPNGVLVTIRDVRFPADSDALENLRAVIELDGELHLRSEEIEFATAVSTPANDTQIQRAYNRLTFISIESQAFGSGNGNSSGSANKILRVTGARPGSDAIRNDDLHTAASQLRFPIAGPRGTIGGCLGWTPS